ncbi:MAG: chemotaxis response regulator protein-glutamate methylesterase [Treponema sp.]|nr:chemotaxis response regulator protein-glutamate methylesterase [Treponema sp.]
MTGIETLAVEPIKLLVIYDSTLFRDYLRSLLIPYKDLKLIASAPNPIMGMDKIKQERPDVILTDIEMSRMDGLSFLQELKKLKNPIPCVVCSTLVCDGSAEAVRAKELGAAAIIYRPPATRIKLFLDENKLRLHDALVGAYNSSPKERAVHTPVPSRKEVQPKLSPDVILSKPTEARKVIETTKTVIVVGASTGGTEALKDFLSVLPEDTPGMVIVQHMPEHFTAAFASRLDSHCKMKVKEAKDGDEVVTGQALIAPGNKHTLLRRSGQKYFVEVMDGPLVTRHRPSVDVLFRSAAISAGKNAIGVIMTGMGDDGAKGMKEMHDMGAYNIAQDENTCIVFGMPAEAIKNGGVDIVVPLQQIARTILARPLKR